MVAFIGGIGGWEILIVLAFALVIFGPQRLPELARGIGKISAQIRAANRQLQRELYENLDPDEIRQQTPTRSAARHVERGEDADASELAEGDAEGAGGKRKKAPGESPGASYADGEDSEKADS